MRTQSIWGVLLLFCVGSRLGTAIFYIEDLDSLRFALSMIEYDVAKLQPHFPAYPVFWLTAKALYLAIDHYTIAFSLIGGLSTWLIIYFTTAFARVEITSVAGAVLAFLLLFNPMLWLMGNRYMPDAMGVAFVMAVHWLVADRADHRALLGFAVAGLSLGVRLSYAPILLTPLFIRWMQGGGRLRLKLALVGTVGVLAWLVPLIAATGWQDLITAAKTQTTGHFTDFGGTISTERHLGERLSRLLEGMWADGFGLYWPGRDPSTAFAALGLIVVLTAGRQPLVERLYLRNLLSIPVLGCLIYLVWIFFFQNVVHKSRHILPLLPFIAVIITGSVSHVIHRGGLSRIALLSFAAMYMYVSSHLAIQHTNPSAVSQVYDYLKSREADGLHIFCTPLIKYYLSYRGLKATYTPVKNKSDLASAICIEGDAACFAVGSPINDRESESTMAFYHNPYVNRMWPELSIYKY